MKLRSNQMKLSDYVAGYLARIGIRHAFIISGGASIHLLHSLDDRTDIEAICPHHEQAAAMSADAIPGSRASSVARSAQAGQARPI